VYAINPFVIPINEPVVVFNDAVVCRILFLTESLEDVYVFTEPLNELNKVISPEVPELPLTPEVPLVPLTPLVPEVPDVLP
jgi:hypothetical protein